MVARARRRAERLLGDQFHQLLAPSAALAVSACTILALRDPALFDRGGNALGERARRHVAVHHRAGAGVGAVADLDRRDEHRVRPGARVGADLRAVLAACRRSWR